ncbi:MAG: adenylate/guanylate cyclase domain-containing protein [Candidatus Rokubacteria bacterium]|nr:adenylate/guanylate cyclase domain-containing protein [Candidatus Rokubacteria bacterium]
MERGTQAGVRHRAPSPWWIRRLLGLTAVVGNLIGALLVEFYFRYVSPYRGPQGFTRADAVYFVVAFGGLMTAGYTLVKWWLGPIKEALRALPRPPSRRQRQRAVLLPYVMAAINVTGWLGGSLLFNFVWQAWTGSLTVAGAAHSMFGTLCIAAPAATAAVFFTVERHWRSVLPVFFPDGDTTAAREVFRFPVGARLLVISLMMSVVPLSLVGVLSYMRVSAALAAGPALGQQIVSNMMALIAFIVTAGTALAIWLSLFVAGSVAGPLRALEKAMADVERGDLGARVAFIGNDEIGAVADGFNRMVTGLRERDFLKETFGKYVTPEIRDEILAGRVALEGQQREVTILFADLRDFTPWVEASRPADVVRDLNAYFTEMEEAIRTHHGLVLQFIGDEIEAVFGAPLARADHAALAVQAAMEMRRRLATWNAARGREGKPPLRHGIGIHTGTVLAGNIGSSERLSYALVGDSVNLASRIQGLTKDFGADILISASTRTRLDGALPLAPLPAVRVKGRSEDVEIYRVA